MAMKNPTKTYRLALIGVMTAILCILGPLSIPLPFSPVPLSLTNFAILLAVVLFGWKRGTLFCGVFLLLGVVGVSVFFGVSGGMAQLLGPTRGGFVGFFFFGVVRGPFVEKFEQARLPVAAGMALGMLVDYLFGTLWLAILMKLSFGQALMMGVVPYLAGDAVKLIIALLLGSALRRRLQALRILV